jgi:type I restriction enzyme S subunit
MVSNQSKAWKVQPLYNLGEVIRGVTYNPELHLSMQDTSTSARLLRSNNVQDTQINFDSIQFVERSCVSKQQEMTNGDILLCMANGSRALVGKAAKFSAPTSHIYTFGAFMGVFRPRNPRDSDYFLFLTQSKKFRNYIDVALSGSSINNLRPSDILQMLFAFPAEQERQVISSVLRDIDNLIIGLNALIVKKRNILQGARRQLLTGQTRLPGFSDDWKRIRLGDYAVFLRTLSYSRDQLTSGAEVSYLHYGDIHVGVRFRLDAVEARMPGISKTNIRNASMLSVGDLVFVDASEDTMGIGKSVEITNVPDGGIVAGLHTIAVRFDKRVLADGFKAYLQEMPSFRGHLLRLASGTKVLSTSKSHIMSAEIALPGTDEQESIATVLGDMDAEIDALIRQRDKTLVIKTGMMQNLLTGKVRL